METVKYNNGWTVSLSTATICILAVDDCFSRRSAGVYVSDEEINMCIQWANLIVDEAN